LQVRRSSVLSMAAINWSSVIAIAAPLFLGGKDEKNGGWRRGQIFDRMLHKGQAEGREVRGPVNHDFVRSLYFRDPNGYVIELTAPTGAHGEIMDPAISKPHEALARWRAIRAAT
jgi:hypothetical protein